jgi:anti-sigma regulatory factor (Ser/Thr protein kinase)
LRRRGTGHDEVIAADLELTLAPTLSAPARARAALADLLVGHGGDRLREIALLLVSELVTNAVRHPAVAAGDILRVSGRLDASVLRLAVWDGGTTGSIRRRAGGARAEPGGFGLELVDRLSSAWGVERNEHGTTVWVELSTVDP